jgi:hypothetical protein
MTAAGFQEVRATTFSAAVHFSSARDYLDRMIRSAAPCAIMRQRLGDEAFEAAMARVLAVLEPRFPAGGRELAAEAILTSASRG